MIWNEILCLGDSITCGARDEYGRSYPMELSKILTERTGEIYICHDHGVCGETSSDLLRRSWDACRMRKDSNIALLMIGTNDTQKNMPVEIYEDINLKVNLNEDAYKEWKKNQKINKDNAYDNKFLKVKGKKSWEEHEWEKVANSRQIYVIGNHVLKGN